MKLRLDLLEYLTDEDILEEALANNHRYKAEPTFGKTGVGYLKPATEEDRAAELIRMESRSRKLMERMEADREVGAAASRDSSQL